jgi:hypothetical protein
LCLAGLAAGVVRWAGLGVRAGLTPAGWAGLTAGCRWWSFVAGDSGRVRWRWGFEAPEPDGGRTVVAGAGHLAVLLDAVAVVAGSFDRAGAAAVASGRERFAAEFGQDVG